jgi:hypothetical protein
MAALVITDNDGGDYVVALVGDTLWRQILAIRDVQPYDAVKFRSWVGFLACGDPEVYRPEGCPERDGLVLDTWYCQAPVVEEAEIGHKINGLLFL